MEMMVVMEEEDLGGEIEIKMARGKMEVKVSNVMCT